MTASSIVVARRGGLRCLAILIAGAALVVAATAAAAEMRTWSDSKGKFRIQARFVSVDGGKVTLEKPDGSEFEIELKRLSEADRKYVAEAGKTEEDPFKPIESNPFKPKEKSAKGEPPASAATAEARVIVPDWSDVRAVDPTPAATEWKLTPGTPPDAALKLRTRPIAIPPKRSFWEGTQALVVNAASRRAVVGYKMDDPKPAGSTRLVLCDLESGKALGAGVAPGQFVPASLHDDGTRVLMRRHEGHWGSNSDRLEVWSLTGTGIKKVLQWVPYDDLQGDNRNVTWAEFVDATHVVTVNKSGKLACWALASAKPQYSAQIQGESSPALSPDRKFIAFSTGKELAVLDVAAGTIVAAQPLPAQNPAWPSLAFSPSCTRIACLAFNDKVYVWDFATGALHRGLSLHGLGNPMGQLLFTTDDHILIGGKTLVDLESQVRLWSYDGHEFVRRLGGLGWFEVSEGEGKPGALVPTPIPQPAARTALEKAMADPNFFVLRPGVTVRVDVASLPDPAQREKVRATLESKLKAAGLRTGSTGTIDLVATVEVGAEQQIHYHLWGGGLKSYNLRPYTSRLKFVSQGQTAWEVAAAHIPFMMRKDETQESYQKQFERPNYDYFAGVDLPKSLTRPTATGTVGASHVTTAGLR